MQNRQIHNTKKMNTGELKERKFEKGVTAIVVFSCIVIVV